MFGRPHFRCFSFSYLWGSLCVGLFAVSAAHAQPQLVFLPAPDAQPVENEMAGKSATAYLEELEQKTSAEVQRLVGFEQPIVVWPELVGLETAEAYSEFPIRYLAVHLRIANTTSAPIEIHPEAIKLKADQAELLAGQLPENFPSYYVELGETMLEVDAIRKPAVCGIGAGEVGELRTIFAPLPATPPGIGLLLEIPVADTTLQLDLRAISNARLLPDAQRIGPGGSLGWVEIDGQFDTVNCNLFAEQIAQWADAGVERFVVTWGPDAPTFDATLFEWLIQPLREDYDNNALFAQMPRLHLAREFHLGALPSMREEGAELDHLEQDDRQHVHRTTAEAVTAALRTLFEAAAPDSIAAELQSPDPLTQIAILKTVPHRLPASQLDTIIKFAQSDAMELRSAALVALGQFNAAAARDVLQAALSSDDQQLQLAATTGVLKSPHPESLELVQHVLDESPLEQQELIRLLVAYPHAAGEAYLRKCLQHADPAVRKGAMTAINALGNPELPGIFSVMLDDPEESVRMTAFRLLSQRPERDAEQHAMRHALGMLERGEFNSSLYAFLSRVRDPRVGPLLLKLLDQEALVGERSTIIRLLGETGDDFTERELIRHFANLDPTFQRDILEVLSEQGAPAARELALGQLDHEDQNVRSYALDILVEDGGEQIEAELSKRLLKLIPQGAELKLEELSFLLEGMARLNGATSHDAMVQFRAFAHQQKLDQPLLQVIDAIRSRSMQSPGWNAAQAGRYYMTQQNNTDDALRYFDLAIQIDPDLVFAHQARGNLLLKKDKLDESLKSFQRGLELDEFDGQSVTGIGIIMARQGKPEEALKFTLASADKFRQDDVFAYNTACVYGRAIENLRTRDESTQRDERIQTYIDAAFVELGRSIEMGFMDHELMREDPDLTSISDDPRFAELLKKIVQLQ
ncbi:MAG: HEAT repeat domain-containing protein [Planctomycetaceae bacterium]|nr:HEAT repeat domain-containing protein [Planctomycetaceae bacterium]